MKKIDIIRDGMENYSVQIYTYDNRAHHLYDHLQ